PVRLVCHQILDHRSMSEEARCQVRGGAWGRNFCEQCSGGGDYYWPRTRRVTSRRPSRERAIEFLREPRSRVKAPKMRSEPRSRLGSRGKTSKSLLFDVRADD